jgi:hypothetical protein
MTEACNYKLAEELSEATDEEDDGSWKNLAEDPWKDHLIPVPDLEEMNKYRPLCDTADDHELIKCAVSNINARVCQFCGLRDHLVPDCTKAQFVCSDILENKRNPPKKSTTQMTWEDWYAEWPLPASTTPLPTPASVPFIPKDMPWKPPPPGKTGAASSSSGTYVATTQEAAVTTNTTESASNTTSMEAASSSNPPPPPPLESIPECNIPRRDVIHP